VLLAELKPYEPKAMRNSIHRYEYIRHYLERTNKVTATDLKTLLLGKYPEGLCCHFHDDDMGTTKSLIMDLDRGQVEICWGGLEGNGWQSHPVSQPLDDSQQSIRIEKERAQPAFFEWINY
jgi:hypothetical protein